MKKAISEVLETMFFLSIDFEDRALEGQVGFCEARIPIQLEGGELSVALKVVEDFARLAAANFLGVDDDRVDDGEVTDVVREMANMVGGGFIESSGDRGARLGIPSFSRTVGEIAANEANIPFTFMGDFAGVVTWELCPSGTS
jgi:hypothetical protein